MSSEWDVNAIVLSSYHVSTKVNSRMLTTSIDMVFENTENCSSIYDLTLHFPRDARITDLVMDLSDGCQLGSEVKNLDDAKEDFKEFSSGGKAAAMLTAWDMSNYVLQVSIPPNGTTSVSLQYQELLFKKLDLVSFQVPMFPGIDVDELKIDVSVEEPNAGLIEFKTDLQDKMIETSLDAKNASLHYENVRVTKDTLLPTLFHAHFRPGPPPEDGLFLSDGECFTHVFNPTSFLASAGSMGRKIVFVIDVSGSMGIQKLNDAKAAFSVMIDSLDERDTLIIRPFSTWSRRKWGPRAATTENKAKAKKYVMKLTSGGATNLNQALLRGIRNVINTQENVASILVAMTDGKGDTSGTEVARNVQKRNKEGKVKIFSMAFGNNADINLLLAIAIQNGGRAVRVYEGFGDTEGQMKQFYENELGTILLSDVSVSYDFGVVGVLESTVTRFPVLAAGSEIVVRGQMDSPMAPNPSRRVKSIVSAKSAVGPKEWPLDHIVIPEDTSRDCRQSFAQARIVELLEYRDAALSIGDELFPSSMSRSRKLNTRSFEEEARTIALDANLVWPGLTALITVENGNCQQNNADVCRSAGGESIVASSYCGTSCSGTSRDRSDLSSFYLLLLAVFGIVLLLF